MSGIFFVLALLGCAIAFGGYGWSVARNLQDRGAEASALEGAKNTSQDGTGAGISSALENTAPTESDPSRTRAALSFEDVGRRVQREGFRAALPWLLQAGGLLAALIFGALALFTSLPSKLFGVAALATAAYVSVTELRAFGKALRGKAP